MEITFAETPRDAQESSELIIKAEENETICVGQMISIELTNESVVDRKIISMRRWFCSEGGKPGYFKDVDYIKDGETAYIIVDNLESNIVHTTTDMPSCEQWQEIDNMICITPYKELSCGEESIYDHTRKGYQVPDKVITYLKTEHCLCVCMGVYDHPFKEGVSISGPYIYADDKYYWDREAWKYVVEYGLELPKEFIDHVMSEEGTKFIKQHMVENESWSETNGTIDKGLEDF